MKGSTLETGTIVTLSLDGTLVYVEDVQPTFAAVVALPEQPPERSDDRVFTPGRVGSKKISPFSKADKTIHSSELSARNLKFISQCEDLRTAHGPNYVDRTPEEQAAFDAKNAGPAPKIKKQKLSPEEKAAARAAKKTAGGPRYLQRCVTCGEQPGHPNHPDQHEFAAPPRPAVLCAACDEPEAADVHSREKADGGHKFIAGKPMKAARVPKEPRAPKARAAKPSKTPLEGPFKWVGSDALLDMLAAVNPKYKDGNSGRAIVQALRDGNATVQAIMLVLAKHERWGQVPLERVQMACGQLLAAKLIEAA